MLPLLLLLMLFGMISMIAWALDFGGARRNAERKTHRRTASGEPLVTEDGGRICLKGSDVYTSPRRGFAFCGSWPHGLEEGAAPPQCRPNGASSFALPQSYVSHPPERRSPGRDAADARRPVDV